jgi:hypothetical protein
MGRIWERGRTTGAGSIWASRALRYALSVIFVVTSSTSWAANEQDIDFDWIFRNLDKLVRNFAPTASLTLSGVDGDGNGLKEDDVLAELAVILRGNVGSYSRVGTINATDAANIRADFVANRTTVDNDMAVHGFLELTCTLVKNLNLLHYNGGGNLPDCKLTTILKADEALGISMGGFISNMLLDMLSGMMTMGDWPAMPNYINTSIITPLVNAALTEFGQAGLSGTVLPDLLLMSGTGTGVNNYRHWGATPGGPAGVTRRNAFGAAGDLDSDGGGNTNAVEYTAAAGNREAFLRSNTLGVYSSQNTDQPINFQTQPVYNVYTAGTSLTIAPTFTSGNAAPLTYQWEDAQDFGDKDSPLAADWGLAQIVNGGAISGATTSSLNISDLSYATHNGVRPWLRISDQVTVYNPIPQGGAVPANAIEADGLGGRTSVFGWILVAETLPRGPISQCTGTVTLTAYAASAEDSTDVDTDADAPTYQWVSGASPGSLAAIGGATTNLLTFNAVAPSEGYYACDTTVFINGAFKTTRTNVVFYDFPTTPLAPSVPDLAAISDSGTSNSDNLTNITTPTFTGTAEAGATVTLVIDSVNNASTTADGSGNWSVAATTLGSGPHTIAAFATNCVGDGPTSSALNITIDTTPPTVSAADLVAGSDSGASNSDNITNNTVITLNGTADASTSVTVTSSISGTIGTSSGPNWSVTTGTLAAGAHSITATATDTAGNTSAPSAPLVVTIDTTAPAAPSVPDLQAASDSGTSNSDNLTNVTTPVFTGTAEAGATVTVASSIAGTIGTGPGASYSVTSSALGDGAHTITAQQTDLAGNTGPFSTGLVVTIDTAGPAASTPDLNAGSDSGASNSDNYTNVTLPGFSGTAESGTTVTILVDGSPNGTGPATGGNYNITTGVALAPGARSISARATDAAGNTGADATPLPITVDTTAPAQPGTPDLLAGSDTGVSNSDDNTSDTTPDLQGTAEAGSVVTVSSSVSGTLGTPTATGGTWNLTPVMTENIHNVTAVAVDLAGNASIASTALALTIDTTAPAAPGAPDLAPASDLGPSNSDDITNDTTPDLSGTAVTGNSVTVSSSLAGVIGTTTAASGSYSITSIALADGTHNVTATQTDLAGNTSTGSASLSLQIDTVAPAVSSETPSRGVTLASLPTVQVTFSKAVNGLTAGALTVEGSPATSISGSGAGPYTFSGYAAPADGTVNIVLTGTGVTGNAGNTLTSDSWTYSKNSSVPTVAISAAAVTNGGTTNASPVGFTVVFSQAVSGFGIGDVSVTGGGASGLFTIIAGTNFGFFVTPSGQGAVSVNIPAAAATATASPFNPSAASNVYNYTYDSVAPIMTVNALTTSNNRPALSGTVTDVDTTAAISLTVASQTVAGVNNGDGTWSLAANVLNTIADGTYSITARATDTAGNIGIDGTSSELTIDTTPPVVTVVSQATNDNTPALNGTVNDVNATVSVTVGSQTFPATVNINGTWDLADDTLTALADGTYNVLVTGTDTLGNAASDATVDELVIDTTAPSVSVVGQLTSDNTPGISGAVNDPTATVSVTVGIQNVAATNNGDGTWTIADNVLTTLVDGPYNVVAFASDAVGNNSTDLTTDELVIDTTAPAILLGGSANDSVSCGVGYTDPGATANDARQGDVSANIVVGGDVLTQLSVPGNYQITYDVQDSLGNVTTQVVRNVTVLNDCPLSVSANATNVVKDEGDTHTFSVTVSGNVGGFTYQWQRDDGSKTWQDISGEEDADFTLSSLLVADSGDYRCEVVDAVTTAYSPVINLTVNTQAALPLAGLAGLGIATALTALAGVAGLRRKR